MTQTPVMISLCAHVSLENNLNILIDKFGAVSSFKINWKEMKIIIQFALSE